MNDPADERLINVRQTLVEAQAWLKGGGHAPPSAYRARLVALADKAAKAIDDYFALKDWFDPR
jgi:hypothetical protein